MLSVKHITKYYGDNKAVDDLSFTVKNGEIFGSVRRKWSRENYYF